MQLPPLPYRLGPLFGSVPKKTQHTHKEKNGALIPPTSTCKTNWPLWPQIPTHLLNAMHKVVLILYVFPEIVLCLQLFLARMTHNPELLSIARQAEIAQFCVDFVVFTYNTWKTHRVVAPFSVQQMFVSRLRTFSNKYINFYFSPK